MKHTTKIFLLLTVLCYISCDNKTKHQVPEEVIEKAFSLKINRFDKDLFALKLDSGKMNVSAMAQQYPDFFYLFTQRIINIGDSSNQQLPKLLQGFLNDQYINEMYNEVNHSFPDLNQYNQALTQAFKGYHYFFPQAKVPEITYFVSGYNFANVTTANTLGIGLEMYLGSAYKPYTLMEIPVYKQKLMSKDYLIADAMQAWIATEFEKEEDYATLLHQILHRAKVIYTMESLMPTLPDTIIFGYSAAQLKWCQNNESKIWAHFIEKKLLFAQLKGDSYKYINEGPFTAGFPRESPGKLGVWLGYQIVKKYIDQQPKITLKQLLDNHNAQQILTQSKYKPK